MTPSKLTDVSRSSDVEIKNSSSPSPSKSKMTVLVENASLTNTDHCLGVASAKSQSEMLPDSSKTNSSSISSPSIS